MQAELTTLVHAVRVRDCVLVTVCALFVYLLRARETYDLLPVWRKHINTQVAYGNGRFPNPTERLPSPVITDIDDDGRQEIVLVSGNFELQICAFPQSQAVATVGRSLPELKDCSSVEMVLDGSHRPVALETGYLMPPIAPDVSRSQVIVLVFNDWTVQCYDSGLRLLWSRVLMDISEHYGYFMNAVGILITPHVLEHGKNGTIIVGASFAHASHTVWKQPDNARSGLSSHQNKSDEETITDEKLKHFSTFALNGETGKEHWHHLLGDFELRPQESASYHWKLGLKNRHWHSGEVHWSKYTDDLLAHLPHSWRSAGDTRFDLSDFRRVQLASDSHQSADTSDKSGLLSLVPLSDIIGVYDEHIAGIPYGGMRAHSRHEHITWPNAVVMHLNTGVEVLSLKTGRPLTHLQLTPRSSASVFADINADNTVEEVRADFALKCSVDVSTVKPRPHALFIGPLCTSPFLWGGMSLSNMFQSSDVVNEDTHLAVTPILVPRVAQSYGMLNHLLGQSLPSEQKGFDSIFMTSSGRLTSYSPSGEPNWQSMLQTTWSQVSLQWELNQNFAASDNGQVYEQAFRPTMKAFSMQIYAKKTALLVTGWDSVALVDLRFGHLAGEHSLPCQPLSEPVVGDLNGDGFNDFIIVCRDGFLGFEIRKSSTFFFTSIVTITVVLSVLLLLWCCMRPFNVVDYTTDRQFLS